MIELTIVIPVYNTELGFVRRCFETVKGQETSFVYDVVVVDDGSEEGYAEGLSALTGEFGFRYMRIPNGGVSNARNIGAENAEGEYVCFVDADDMLSPYFLQDMLEAAQKYDADYVVGLIEDALLDEIEGKWGALRPACDESVTCRSASELVASFLLEGLDATGQGRLRSCPFARLERRANGRFAPFDTDFALGEDTLQNLSYLRDCDNVVVVNNTCYLYRTNPDSVCHTFDPGRVEAVERLMSAIREVVERDFPGAAGNLEPLALCWLVSLVKTYFLNPEYQGDAVAEFNELVRKPLWREAVRREAAVKLPVRYRIAALLVRLRLARVLFAICG